MKKFNKEIQVTVSVDSIANQLLEQLNPEFKHREIVAESIIGRMVSADENGLSVLYNTLNGYTQDIDFKVDEEVLLDNVVHYGSWNGEGEKSEYKEIKSAKIVDIDLYADKKVCIEYPVSWSDEPHRNWIDHTKCAKISVVPPLNSSLEDIF